MRRLSFFVLLGPSLAFLTLLTFLLPLLLTRPLPGYSSSWSLPF